MFTPAQSLFIKGSSGDPLPKVWDGLEQVDARFLRGQVVLICAGPGVGKSALVLALALKSKVPTLYFSADSDAYTQLTRSMSIITGWSLRKTEELVRSGSLGTAAKEFAGIPIRFSYRASPTLENIEDSLRAYDEVDGDFPALVVVDNITNVRTGGVSNDDDPFAGLEALMDYLHTIARNTGSCVVGLHHVTGTYNDGDKPIPLSGVKGQIARVPEMVLTLHKQTEEIGPDTLCVSPVKNRFGKADPSGYTFAELQFHGDNMQIKDTK